MIYYIYNLYDHQTIHIKFLQVTRKMIWNVLLKCVTLIFIFRESNKCISLFPFYSHINFRIVEFKLSTSCVSYISLTSKFSDFSCLIIISYYWEMPTVRRSDLHFIYISLPDLSRSRHTPSPLQYYDDGDDGDDGDDDGGDCERLPPHCRLQLVYRAGGD